MKKSTGIIAIVLILAILGGLGYYGSTIFKETAKNQKEGTTSEEGIKLGLDLSGGVSVTYKIKDENPTAEEVSDTVEKLKKRAETFTTEYSVYKSETNDRITVEIPGVKDASEVLEGLGAPGSLYFIVQTDADGNQNFTWDSTYVKKNGEVGNFVLNYDIEQLIENGSVILTGEDVKASQAVYETNSVSNSKKPVTQLQFNDDAAEIFAEATKKAAASGERIGIYYDGEFISCPTVDEEIGGGSCVINGATTYEDADELATYIRIGAMKLELELLEYNVVGAQLGGEALSTSVLAGLIGLLLVMIFMIVMYRVPGVAAAISLGMYSVLVVEFIYWFEVTLTLPGIAGIILGIGMAVDANVIIFARIREEIAKGKMVDVAVKEGYKKALSAILDGQITTFIAAVVLMFLGSGTVKGFAYTLMISIVLSLFTSLVLARLLTNAFVALGIKNEKFYGRAKERKPFNFMKHRIVYFAISLVVILAGVGGMVGYGVSGNRMLNFSLEFVGGNSATFEMPETYTVDRLEAEVVPAVEKIVGSSAIQATTVDGNNNIVLKTPMLSEEQSADLEQLMETEYGAALVESQGISSTISGEMTRSAIIAVALACFLMLLYIAFRFKDFRFAGSAILALVHDVLVVLTAYALIRISVGNTFIACMLTIVGYSINDTIVIFDRIRENLKGVKVQTKESLAEVANRSLTQTLSRSINTSITTMIMVLMLIILGVSSIREFAIPLMVGLICGSYSSIFIATELWYVMKLHLGKNRVVK